MLGAACSLNGKFHLPTERLDAGAPVPAGGASLSLLSDQARYQLPDLVCVLGR